MPRGRYATVKIPEELAKTLDGFTEAWGYRSRAEIVDEAIRAYILRMKELKQAESRRS
jgi:metal-responsive CopG/Arc/MetJ family transcriptional regulator